MPEPSLTGGLVRLHVERVGGEQRSSEAVVALAGGPGEAAVAQLPRFLGYVEAGLHGRDLVVFDQRGTGRSQAARCVAAEQATRPLVEQAAACAAELGSAAGAYRTADSVGDLEAIRVALGYQRLVLVGVSYGTFVALRYAAAHPDRVAALILDSPLTSAGPDPLRTSSLAAAGQLLDRACNRQCRAAGKASTQLARLLSRFRRGPVVARVPDSGGRLMDTSVDASDVADLVQLGDRSPRVRPLLISAIRSALNADRAPLARLARLLLAGRPTQSTPDITQFNPALFFTTACSDASFPWPAGTASDQRLSALQAAANELPDRLRGGFPAGASTGDALTACVGWPLSYVQPAPPALPRLPTLVLSGVNDMRTPSSDADQVARQLGGQVVRAPVAHAVLSNDSTGCAQRAVTTFLQARPVKARCPRYPEFDTPPAAPRRLAEIAPAPGDAPRAVRRVAAATEMTVADTLTVGQFAATGGGLRAGRYAISERGTLRLRELSFVLGLSVSGTVTRSGNWWRITARTRTGTITLRSTGLRSIRAVYRGRSWQIARPLL